MKCRRNYTTKDNGRSIIFFGSKGRDELGHAIFSENVNDHQYYLITCIHESVASLTSEDKEFDVAYKYTGEDYKLFKYAGEPNLITLDKVKEKIKALGKELHIIENVEELSRYFAENINRQNNYSSDGEAVKDSLIQRLSVLKRELWYKRSYGLPLMDKIKNKGFIDIVVLDILSSHPSVVNVANFTSSLAPNHVYSCSFDVVTKFASKEIKETLNIQM